MEREIVEKLKTWFDRYTQSFLTGDENFDKNIRLKEEHTKRVYREILALGKDLRMGDDKLRIAEVGALFHDIGRFEQYAHYKTFRDKESVNHAELGVKILMENHVLNGIPGPDRELIKKMILYHNRRFLPERENGKCLFLAKLLRDADKLDIWKVVTDYYVDRKRERNPALELGLPDTPGISSEVRESIIQGRNVDLKNVKNLNDLKLLQVSWVYDVNFYPTISYIIERGYMGKIRSVLPVSDEIKNIFSVVLTYMETRLLKERS